MKHALFDDHLKRTNNAAELTIRADSILSMHELFESYSDDMLDSTREKNSIYSVKGALSALYTKV